MLKTAGDFRKNPNSNSEVSQGSSASDRWATLIGLMPQTQSRFRKNPFSVSSVSTHLLGVNNPVNVSSSGSDQNCEHYLCFNS